MKLGILPGIGGVSRPGFIDRSKKGWEGKGSCREGAVSGRLCALDKMMLGGSHGEYDLRGDVERSQD